MTRGFWTPARTAGAALAAMLVVLDLAGAHAHAESWWHAMPSFDLLYGVAGCIAIVIVSKLLGSAWLQRRERYYERET